MARIELPAGNGSEVERAWSLRPDVGGAVETIITAATVRSKLAPRVREAARMRIAQVNQCQVCLGFRMPALERHGVTEDFYAGVASAKDDPQYSDAERLAIEYAERFALAHLTIDDAFMDRLREHFDDEDIFDLTILLAECLGFGRLTQVLQLDHACEVVTGSPDARRRT